MTQNQMQSYLFYSRHQYIQYCNFSSFLLTWNDRSISALRIRSTFRWSKTFTYFGICALTSQSKTDPMNMTEIGFIRKKKWKSWKPNKICIKKWLVTFYTHRFDCWYFFDMKQFIEEPEKTITISRELWHNLKI